MLDLLPLPNQEFICPGCQRTLVNDAVVMPGMIPLMKTHCPKCGRSVLCHLRHGFVRMDLMFDEHDNKLVSVENADWYENIFKGMIETRDRPPPPLERITHRPLGRDVILVNALEPTYGHILQRLFSIDAFKDEVGDADLVVIVPRLAAWMVPDGVAETWIVDAPQRQLGLWNSAVADATAALAKRVARLRLAPMRMDHYVVDIARYTKVAPFEPYTLADILPAKLTVIWREDRCWTYRGLPQRPEAAVAEQFAMVSRMLDILREQIPDLDVAVTGYGRHGAFADWIQDMRVVEHDTAREQEWMRRYAATHLIFGVHGSNMILPPAHALGSVELVPTFYWRSTVTIWQWANRLGGGEALSRFLLIPLSTSFSEIISIVFIQLRRVQSLTIYHLRGRLKDSLEHIRLEAEAWTVLQGGRALEYRDESGRVL